MLALSLVMQFRSEFFLRHSKYLALIATQNLLIFPACLKYVVNLNNNDRWIHRVLHLNTRR